MKGLSRMRGNSHVRFLGEGAVVIPHSLPDVPSEKRLAHTGVVLSVKRLPDGRYECVTVEGNTNRDGSREGDSVLIKTRVFNTKNGAKSDCFIRWTILS